MVVTEESVEPPSRKISNLISSKPKPKLSLATLGDGQVVSMNDMVISDTSTAFREAYFPEASAHQWNDWRWQLRSRIRTVEKLEQVFELIGKRPKAEKCDAMDGILEEATGLLEDFTGGAANDSAIIFSAQAVEHYEISRYGSMHAYAVQLGMTEVAALIKGVLDQEYAADKSLTALADVFDRNLRLWFGDTKLAFSKQGWACESNTMVSLYMFDRKAKDPTAISFITREEGPRAQDIVRPFEKLETVALPTRRLSDQGMLNLSGEKLS